MAFRAVDLVLKLSTEKGINPQRPLVEVQGLLHSCTRKTLERMADIDAKLRKPTLTAEAARRSTAREQQAMEQFIGRRIAAELAVVKRPSSFWKAANTWWKEHPLVPWFITATRALIGVLSRLVGAW